MPLVTGLADGLAGVGARAAVAHLEEELDDEPLEELGRGGLDAREDLGSETRRHLLVCDLEGLLGGLGVRVVVRGSGRALGLVLLGRPELDELGVLLEELDVDAGGWRLEDAGAAIGQLEVAALGREEQPGLLQVRLCPGDAIRELRLVTAREELVPIDLRELEDGGERLAGLGKRMRLAVGGELQQRQHQGLEIRDCHAHPQGVSTGDWTSAARIALARVSSSWELSSLAP
jgi:hypothetical protein